MDELTRSILADIDDQKAHPDDWRVTTICDNCGRQSYFALHKSEVEKERQRRNISGPVTIATRSCEKCEEQEEEDNDA